MSDPRGRPRLGINVVSNLGANIWLAAISLLSIPVVYKALGAAQYALVGLYLLAVQWSVFVDLGMSPALGRYAAQQNTPQGSYARVRFMLGRFEWITAAIATLVALAGLFVYRQDVSLLPDQQGSIESAGLIGLLLCLGLALRIAANLYRAGLTGLEHQVLVSAINVAVTTLRLGVPIVLAFAGKLSLAGFFQVQVLVGVLEIALLRHTLATRLGPGSEPVGKTQMREQILLGLSIAGLGVLWILVMQVDKLVLSRVLSAASFGDYVLAVQIAGAVGLATTPIQTAVLPRMTAQMAAGEHGDVAGLYSNSCIVSMAIGLAAMFAVLVCGDTVLALVTDVDRAKILEPLLATYTLATGLIAIMALSYALQNAAGTLRWHWTGSVGLALVQLPLMVVLAQWGDVLKLALAYLLTLAMFVVAWLRHAHRRILQTSHLLWVQKVLLLPAVAAALAGSICMVSFAGGNRWPVELLQGVLTFGLVFTLVICTSADIRHWLRGAVRRA